MEQLRNDWLMYPMRSARGQLGLLSPHMRVISVTKGTSLGGSMTKTMVMVRRLLRQSQDQWQRRPRPWLLSSEQTRSLVLKTLFRLRAGGKAMELRLRLQERGAMIGQRLSCFQTLTACTTIRSGRLDARPMTNGAVLIYKRTRTTRASSGTGQIYYCWQR
jgi:hypothetical protein